MSTRSPKQTVERLYELLTDGEYEQARDLLAPEYHSHTQPHEVSPDALFREIEALKATMTSLQRRTVLTMEDGDMGVIFQRVEGVHVETGEPMAYRSADFFRVNEAGRLTEHWDALTFDGEDLFDTIKLGDR